MQKIRKKYRTVKAVGPERTYERTDGRTYESEFIGSFRSLKTSGEPKKGPKRVKNFDVRILNSFLSLINTKLRWYNKT